MSARIAPLLILSMKPVRLAHLEEFGVSLGFRKSMVTETIASLIKAGVIVRTSELGRNGELRWFQNIQRNWCARGWVEAAEYHLSTYDYDFLGLDPQYRSKDTEIMRHYDALEGDRNRTKTYPDAKEKIPLPRPSRDLARIPLRRNPASNSGGKLTKEDLFVLLALTFGIVTKIRIPWSDHYLLLRTSPSGGARHPSEAYLAVKEIESLTPGWYHIGIEPPQLELIKYGRVDHSTLSHILPATYGRPPFNVRAIVVITSLFERNMYRYREPRTFRTVHMDAGHLAGTLELLAEALGVKVFVQYVAREQALEEHLGIDGLEEGYMISAALG